MFAQEKPITDFKLMSSTADFMELHNIAKLNANPTANTPDYSWESIEEWREADKNPNGIYTNPVTGQQIPNWLAYPNTDWAQILFQPAFYQKYGVNVSGGSKTQLTCCHSVIRIIRELWTIPVWNVLIFVPMWKRK